MSPNLCPGHHGSPWAAHRRSSQPQPEHVSTPASQQPRQMKYPSFLLSPSLMCSLFLCGQLKNGPCPWASGKKSSIFNRKGQDPSAHLHLGHFRACPGLTELRGGPAPPSLWLPQPSPARGQRSLLPISIGSCAFHAALAQGVNTSLSRSAFPCPLTSQFSSSHLSGPYFSIGTKRMLLDNYPSGPFMPTMISVGTLLASGHR